MLGTVKIIEGFIQCSRFGSAFIGIISRICSRRSGTRFNSRGINDDGYVSNFVETEVIINGDCFYSHVSCRGSVPLFWEQNGLQIGTNITFTRSESSSKIPFDTHFNTLSDLYGSIVVLDLLSKKMFLIKEIAEV